MQMKAKCVSILFHNTTDLLDPPALSLWFLHAPFVVLEVMPFKQLKFLGKRYCNQKMLSHTYSTLKWI